MGARCMRCRNFAHSRTWRVGICSLCVLFVQTITGCDATTPFLLSSFNSNLPAGPIGVGVGATDNGGADADTANLRFVDQLPADQRTFNFGEANSSEYPTQWRALFVVSAGEGGFVRNEADIQDYMSAGYEDVLPPNSEVGASVEIGCVTHIGAWYAINGDDKWGLSRS